MSVAKSGLYIFGANFLNLFSGYLFWVLLSRFAGSQGPEMIGYVSSAVAFSTVISTISLLGIPLAVQRFIGKAYAEKKTILISSFFATSLIIVLITSISASAIIIIFHEQVMSFTKFSWQFLAASVIMLIGLAIFQLLNSVLIAINKSKYFLLANIVQGISKILLMIVLFLNGFGLIGIITSYVAALIISIPILLSAVLVSIPFLVKVNFIRNSKDFIRTGSANWIPAVVSSLGGQISVLFVLGYSGAQQAGTFYIASLIFSVVTAIPMALFSGLYPVLSGMINQKINLTWNVTKIGLLFSIPLAVIVGIYSKNILGLLNPQFGLGSTIQTLFMIAVVPTILNYGIYYLLYSSGKNRNVLMIGLVDNLTRVALYILLVPQYGSLGATIAFISGSFAALVVIICTQRKFYIISWGNTALIIVVPALIGLALLVLKINPIAGIPLILIISFFMYVRFTMISLGEMESIIFAILPKDLAQKTYAKVEHVVKVIGQTNLHSKFKTDK